MIRVSRVFYRYVFVPVSMNRVRTGHLQMAKKVGQMPYLKAKSAYSLYQLCTSTISLTCHKFTW